MTFASDGYRKGDPPRNSHVAVPRHP
jgi:hypothetical protein